MIAELLTAVPHGLCAVAMLMFVWGALIMAVPFAWSTWLTRVLRDEPECAGGLLVAAIQTSIMPDAAFGGVLLDHSSRTTFVGSAVILLLAMAAPGRRSHVPT